MSKENLYNEIKKNKQGGGVDLSFMKDIPSAGMSYTKPVTWGIGGAQKQTEQKTAQSTQAVPTKETPSTLGFTGEVAKETAQGSMRAYAALGPLVAPGSPTLTPEGRFQEAIYGTNKPITLRSVGGEVPFVKEEAWYAPAVGFAMGALDLIPGGKPAKDALIVIAKETNPETIAKILRETFKDLSDPKVAENLGIALDDVTDPLQVQQIIEHAINMERKKNPVTTKYWYDNQPKAKADEVVVSFVETGGDIQYVNTIVDSTKQYPGTPQFGVIKKSLLEDTGHAVKTENGVYTIPRALANQLVLENTVTQEVKRVPIRGEQGQFLGSFMDEPAKQTNAPFVEGEYRAWLRNQPNAIKRIEDTIKKAEEIQSPKVKQEFLNDAYREIDNQFIQEYQQIPVPERAAFTENGILFDRTITQINNRLSDIFGRPIDIRTTTNKDFLRAKADKGDESITVYGRAKEDAIWLLERNKTFSEAVANHEGWHWFKRNLSDSKRKELDALEKELMDARPDLVAKMKRDYPKATPQELAEEIMADEFARYTRTGRTVSEKLKLFFDNAMEALLRVFRVRDDVLAKAEKEFSRVKKTLKEDGGVGTRGSASKQIEQKNLLAVHNLSEAKLRFADRVGGLANPSVAVINPKITGFENYGDISLIGDRNLIEGQKTHLADAYSPRFPSVHSTMKWDDFKKLENDLQPYYDEISKLGTEARKLNHEDVNMIGNIENAPAVALKFLKEKGIKPSTEGQFYYHGQIQKAGLDADYQDFLDNLYKEYSVFEQMFAGYTNAGKRRYKPVSVEEASKIMGKQKEEGFNYGLGSFRSKVVPVKKKVSDIRKQQGRLVSKEEFEAVKESYDKELWALKDELEPFARKYDSNSFVEADMQVNMIGNVLTGEDVGMRAFKSKYPEAPTELVGKVLKFRDKLKDMPTEYFETKFRRPVDLSEFRIALVPEDISPQARKILQDKGLRVETYAKGEKQEAMKRLLNDEGDVAFKQVSNVDRLIAEGKIRVVSRDGRDVYQVTHG